MGGSPLLVFAYAANCLALFGDAIYLETRYQHNTSITLTCHYDSWSTSSIRWFRNGALTLKTKWKSFERPPSLEYETQGEDLKTRVELKNWYKIKLRIFPVNNGTSWHCCKYLYIITGECSDSHTIQLGINGTSSSDRNRSSILTSDQDIYLNGTLTLTKLQEEPFQVTLSCTIDEDIEQNKWYVLWYRNGSLVWQTNGTSAVKEKDYMSPNGSTSTAVEDEVHVAKSSYQYNVTFNVSEETIGTWNCFNLFLRVNNKLSNNITIDTTVDFSQGETSSATQDEVTTSATTQDVGTASQTTPDEEKTSASTPFTVTPFAETEDVGRISQTTQNAYSTPVGNQDANVGLRGTLPSPVSPSSLDGELPVIAGTLCGVIALLIICVILVILLRRNRKSKEAQEKKSGGPQSDRREGVVMEDNELYEGGTFGCTADTQKKAIVMEDNELYEGGTMKDKDTGKNEIVMEDNTIYEGGNYTLAGDVEKEQIEMQVNEIYSSSP